MYRLPCVVTIKLEKFTWFDDYILFDFIFPNPNPNPNPNASNIQRFAYNKWQLICLFVWFACFVAWTIAFWPITCTLYNNQDKTVDLIEEGKKTNRILNLPICHCYWSAEIYFACFSLFNQRNEVYIFKRSSYTTWTFDDVILIHQPCQRFCFSFFKHIVPATALILLRIITYPFENETYFIRHRKNLLLFFFLSQWNTNEPFIAIIKLICNMSFEIVKCSNAITFK